MAAWRGIVCVVAGSIVLLSAIAHALLGWPPLHAALTDVAAGDDLVASMAMGWYFGSLAIVAFGLIVMAIGIALLRGRGVSTFPAQVIAVAYLLFGAFAYVSSDFDPHFFLFIGLGLLIGAAAFGGRPAAPSA